MSHSLLVGSPVTSFLMSEEIQEVVPEDIELTDEPNPIEGSGASFKVASVLAILFAAALAILL